MKYNVATHELVELNPMPERREMSLCLTRGAQKLLMDNAYSPRVIIKVNKNGNLGVVLLNSKDEITKLREIT